MGSLHPVKKFVRQNSWYSAAGILRDWIAIALVIWLNVHYGSIWLYLPSLWIIGAFQFALSESMLHEAAHHNLFRLKTLNYRAELFYALPFFRTVKLYKKEHMLHHRYLGKEEDQLMMDYKLFGFSPEKNNAFWLWFVKPLTGYAAYFYTATITFKPFKTEGIKIAGFWTILVMLSVIFNFWQIILLYWIVPMLWCCHSYLYWSEVTDHYNTITSTRSNLNWFTNFLTHNNGYHYIHHKYPTIPWFNLPKAHKELTNGEGDISHGFFDTYRQIRKVRKVE